MTRLAGAAGAPADVVRGSPGRAAVEAADPGGGGAREPDVAHGTGLAAGAPPAVPESGPAEPRPAVDPASKAMARACGEDAALSPAQRRRADRRAAGRCIDCGAGNEGDRVRCPGCRARIAAADRRRRARARLGEALAPRLERAARAGTSVRLSAADVVHLVAGEAAAAGRDFRRRLAAVGRPPAGSTFQPR